MAVTLRLYRLGKRGQPSYRVVAIDKRKKRNGVYLDIIGFYDPLKKKKPLTINKEKLTDWIKKGAQLSEGLKRLIKKD